MQRYKQFEPLIITSLETEKWPHPLHNHNYFELVYIEEGAGIHIVNRQEYSYREGDLFLLGPDDVHEFNIRRKTKFIHLKFTSLYFRDHSGDKMMSEWNKNMDYLLHFIDNRSGSLLQDKNDREIIEYLFHAAMIAKKKKKALYESLIFQLITFVLSLIKEQNNTRVVTENRDVQSVIEKLLLYIEENIHEPQKLTLDALSGIFHYSPNYIGILFKEKMGVTLSEYINMQKLRLIERRLKYGKHSVKQVSIDFGFVDESHFNKFFKKHKGITPTAFKESCAHC